MYSFFADETDQAITAQAFSKGTQSIALSSLASHVIFCPKLL